MDQQHISSFILPHHIPEEFCRNRAAYRQGRKLTAVKVYTVSKESSHLFIFNVPAINLSTELQLLCERFGKLTLFEKLSKGLELEEFTEVFHVNYLKLPSARFAKKQLDNRSFYGGFLHVCYAPEKEILEETRMKLITRRNEVAIRTGRKVKMKNVSSQQTNILVRKVYNNYTNLPEAGASGIKFPKKVPDVTNQTDVKHVGMTLIPTSVLKKRKPSNREHQNKTPRIIFHNISETK